MVEINLYQAKGIDIEIKFPSQWDELTHEEVIQICKLQLLNSQNDYDNKAELFFFIIKNRCQKKNKPLPPDWQAKIDIDILSQSLYLLDFIYKENNLTKQPFKELTVGKKVLIGLDNDFENITCGEFECLELLFHEFNDFPSAELLAKMCAIIFKEKGKAFQEIINDKLVTYDFESASKGFLEQKAWLLYSIYIWYCGCRLSLPLKFPTVYEGDGKESEPDALSFTKCIHAGAGVKNGTRNQIRLTLLLEFMFDMEQEAIKTKELNAQYE